MTESDSTTVLATIIGLFTPAIVDVLKRPTWGGKAVILLGLIVSTTLFVGLHALMGTLVYPVPVGFFVSLLAVYGVQQLSYGLIYKDRNPEPTTTTQTTVIPSGGVVIQQTDTVAGTVEEQG